LGFIATKIILSSYALRYPSRGRNSIPVYYKKYILPANPGSIDIRASLGIIALAPFLLITPGSGHSVS